MYFPPRNKIGHPHREAWHAIGRRFRQRFHLSDGDEDDNDHDVYPPHPTGSCRVQCVRSVSDWSHGVLTEHSIQNACKYFLFFSFEYCRLVLMLCDFRHSADHGS